MAEALEAEGLLRTGALYLRRVGLKPDVGDLIFAGQKRGAFSLYFGDSPIYHFDLEGRWQRVFREGTHYRKGLDNSVAAIERVREGANLVLRRRILDAGEVAKLDEDLRLAAIELMRDGGLQRIAPPPGVQELTVESLASTLSRIGEWNASSWSSHQNYYRETYGPIGFLPPDAHQSIVVQPTEKSLEQFEKHLQNVKALWGKRSLQANHIFLGCENTIRLPRTELLAIFDAINRVFPIQGNAFGEDAETFKGIDVLLSDFAPGLPDLELLTSLAAAGLRRVNLKISSETASLAPFVSDLKQAGLKVAVIVPVGEQGTLFADVSRLIVPCPLGPGDLVYLIDAAEIDPDGEHISAEAAAEQSRKIVLALDEARREQRFKVVPYSLDKQWN